MSDAERSTPGEPFESAMLGEGGEVPMPSSAAESRGTAGTGEDQDVAEQHLHREHRVIEGYVRPGEPGAHTD